MSEQWHYEQKGESYIKVDTLHKIRTLESELAAAREGIAKLKEQYTPWWARKRSEIDKLREVTEQRDQYKAALQSADNHNHEIATKLEIVTEQRDSIDSMYHKVIKEVLECDPIPACQREDDQLESPWEVIARIREQRDRLAEVVNRWRKGKHSGEYGVALRRCISEIDEALQSLNQNQPALPTASATPLHP